MEAVEVKEPTWDKPISWFLNKNGSDKCKHHTYQYIYDDLFAQYPRNHDLDILESGIEYGGSLSAWKEYFPNARVTGVDVVDARLAEYVRNDVDFIVGDIKHYVPDRKFDLIIEDGNHSNGDAIEVALNLSKHLKDYGYLIIEDVQEGFMIPFILWGKLTGDYVVTVYDMRRITNSHDNFAIRIQKIIVERDYGRK